MNKDRDEIQKKAARGAATTPLGTCCSSASMRRRLFNRVHPWLSRALKLSLIFIMAVGCSRSTHESEEKHTVPVTTKTFSRLVEGSKGLAIVDFWASWCAPCRAIAPYLENMAREFEGRLTVFKVDTEENPRLAEKFKIRGLPTLVLFKDGVSIDMRMGAASETELRAWVEGYL